MDFFLKEICQYLKKYFNIDTTITNRKAYNIRKDEIITRPTKIYLLGESVKIFSKEIGFEGEKQVLLNKLMGLSEVKTS